MNWFQKNCKIKKKKHDYFLSNTFPFGMIEGIKG